MYIVRRKRIALLSISVVLLLAFWYAPTWAQDARTGWTPPQIIGDGWWQSITVDRQGTAHIGWYGGIGNSDAMMYAARAFGGEWTPVNDVLYTGTCCWTVRNALGITSTGLLGAVFRNSIGFHMFATAPAQDAANASAWASPIRISNTGYYVDMLVDRNDVFHIVYAGREAASLAPVSVESDPCPYCADLYYRRSDDGGKSWTSPQGISVLPNTGTDRPHVWEGMSGRIYIEWDEGSDWYAGRGEPMDVRLVYSNDGGLTWSEPRVLDGGDLANKRPIQLATTERQDGSLVAVWRYNSDDDRHIYFQISNDLGMTWTEPEPIEGVYVRPMNDTPLDDYELLTDRLGLVHLFMVGQPDLGTAANASLYHIEYRQDGWGTKQRVFYSPEERPEWPKAAIGPQEDIHLTWFVRNLAEGISTYASATVGLRVYYSHRGSLLANQPTQAFNPTPTPQPTATLQRQLVATVTPLPTVEPIDTLPTITSRDNYAARTVVLGMFATALLCVGVVLWFNVRRYMS